MKQYNPQKIEQKWQKVWEKQGLFRAKDGSPKPKFYCLVEFPYPSGDGLHVGHLRSYSALDAVARQKRMQGYNVLYPMGWDAFGLPTENYAIKTGMQPQVVTRKNVAVFKKQTKRMGLSFDWSREINTTDPKYYKWTQWIFLQLFKKGLAYQKEMPVNWCPSCKIGLANEEVVNGKCERCGAKATKKKLKQWMLKITAYAERLLKDLDKVDYSPRIKEQQVNWIGHSEGAEIIFPVVSGDNKMLSCCHSRESGNPVDPRLRGDDSGTKDKITGLKVFTTRPDTLFGATYMVVCPEHSIIENCKLKIENWDEVQAYIKKAIAKSDLERTDLAREKTGVELKGMAAINPVNNKKIPIFVADYVLPHYGTGAIMAVPAHDQRDFDFAKKYSLSVTTVILSSERERGAKDPRVKNRAYEGQGRLINSEQFNDMDSKKAADEIVKWLAKKKLAKKAINYKLRDWLFSRQHYWGEPIPIVHCEGCARQNKDVLVLHGWEDSSKSGFIPALTKDLTKKGYRALAYDAPNTEAPNFEQWYRFAEQKIKTNKLQNFTLVGHSMGGLLALKLAEKYKIKKLVLIAPVGSQSPDKYFNQFKEQLNQKEIKVFKDYQNQPLNIKKIKASAQEIVFIFGAKDDWITKEIRDFYISNFKDVADIKILKDKAHMSESEGVKRLEVLEDLFEWQAKTVPVAVPERDLPVKLPQVEKYQPTGTGQSPLAGVKNWVNTKCPKCGGPAKRETDTMPNWAGSSWYFLRYCDPQNDKKLADFKKLKYWLPVDLYNGGMEHTTLHLLYSRFWHKFLYDIGVAPTREPYAKRRSHGVVLAEDSQKMSKSRGNVINPDEMIEHYGADTLRIYEMFMGPFSQTIPWSTQGMIGVRRFLEKVWNLATVILSVASGRERSEGSLVDASKGSRGHLCGSRGIAASRLVALGAPRNDNIESLLHQTIKKVTEDLDKMHFNTAVSALMILTNHLTELKDSRDKSRLVPTKKAYQVLLVLLAPFAPHLAEELWQQLGNKKSIFLQPWPKYNPKLIKEKTFELIIQINGKMRDKIRAKVGISQRQAEKLAMASEKVQKWAKDKRPKKVVFVKDRLINLVI